MGNGPFTNGQLGWENGNAHYIVAWNHGQAQPSISESIALNYTNYGSEGNVTRTIDFVVEYARMGDERTITSKDGYLSIVIPKRVTDELNDLYFAIATSYDQDMDPPDGFAFPQIDGKDGKEDLQPYYITALSPTLGEELKSLDEPIALETNKSFMPEKLFYLTYYPDFNGERQSHWVEVTDTRNIRNLGVFGIFVPETQVTQPQIGSAPEKSAATANGSKKELAKP